MTPETAHRTVDVSQSWGGADARALWSPQVIWALALTVLLVLGKTLPAVKFFASQAHYLPLHTVLETLSIAVSAMVFALAWSLRGQAGNEHRLLVGTAFLGVCLIDMAHTLSFAGMPELVTPSSPEKAINFWLAGRCLAAAALLAVGFNASVRWPPVVGVVGALLLAVGVWWVGLWHAD
jgi:hypothetical protein